ncbi:hypothetical protein [Catalinimonas niigatensis]|uniref:hypothetical protein n=1 Tax=Catalinimonas niigatensis TaxID=1397264 RepID=UPI002666063A|nr:hypothetical protein [Catalinimonas niigatensis]WPP50499.1 hypothetical protein PZB72_27930 [Catalinimonas niigatensis]
MIRIYLDWNVISNLKKPEFREIKDFIITHKKHLQFPYSPAHFADLMKSYKPNNEHFHTDLETLEFLSEKHLIRWGEKEIEPLFATPKEYFEFEKDKENIFELIDMEKIFQDLDESMHELGLKKMETSTKSFYQSQPSGIEITEESKDILKKMFPNLKSNSTMWDLMKDMEPFSKKVLQDGKYYKELRNSLAEKGFRLEANSGRWNYDEVVRNINNFLQKLGVKMTFLEYVELSFKHKKEPVNPYEYYITAYLILDMIGYRTDKLPKPTDNMLNIQTDGEHSFYGAYCNYLVASDKNLRIKSKVLYNQFNISTKILEPNDLIPELKKVIDPDIKEINFLEEALSFCTKENLVESFPASEENSVETQAFRLPKFYFNYFNYVIYTYYPKQEGFVLTFRKVFKNLSRFIYYTESESLIERITDFFGYENKEELRVKKQEFVYKENNIVFDWSFDGGLIRLENEEDTKRPILSYIISTKGIMVST